VRSFLPAYELRAPANFAAALDLLAREPGVWKPLAGGTDVMVLFEAGKLPHRRFFSLWKLAELRGIEVTPAHVTVHALTTYTDVQRHPVLQSEFPLLCRAARETGGIATQNRGTLGGNIVNASPAADSPPALLVYDADLELVSACGARWVPYHGFHTGYKTILMRSDELVRSIRLPRNKQSWRQYYRKVGTRKAQAISKVCLAAATLIESGVIRDARIAFGSVAPIVLRCAKTEALLQGRRVDAALVRAARESLAAEISPIDDVRSTAHYRLRVSQNLLAEFLSDELLSQ
jgi:CO/xanthine dehydrogenase FAD-binding subunit